MAVEDGAGVVPCEGSADSDVLRACHAPAAEAAVAAVASAAELSAAARARAEAAGSAGSDTRAAGGEAVGDDAG